MYDANEIASFVDNARSDFEADLAKLVNIPSVSMDPAYKSNISQVAEAAERTIIACGGRAEVISTAGNPVVVGEFKRNPDYPTLLIYNHLDVQPADPTEWETLPFKLTIQGEKYIGRGATDDKGPALTALYAAKFANTKDIPINIKFVWELEEEDGSPSFEPFLEKHKNLLACDSIVVSDSVWVLRSRPAIGYGLRGLQTYTLRLKTGEYDVHSGTTGGLARNPVAELAQAISQCYDARTGEVLIPGFYDDVHALTIEERENFIKSGYSTDEVKRAYGLFSLRTEDNADAVERVWARPTFEVHGIAGGYRGPGVKTIIPHYAEAKISTRLVPFQNPERLPKLLSDFVKEKNADIEVLHMETLPPYVTELNSEYGRAAVEAMRAGFGMEPSFIRGGGSNGAIAAMHNVFGKPIVFLNLSLPEHGYHSINEYFDWGQASGGMKMFVKYFAELASRP